jgi:hypothetical protein
MKAFLVSSASCVAMALAPQPARGQDHPPPSVCIHNVQKATCPDGRTVVDVCDWQSCPSATSALRGAGSTGSAPPDPRAQLAGLAAQWGTQLFLDALLSGGDDQAKREAEERARQAAWQAEQSRIAAEFEAHQEAARARLLGMLKGVEPATDLSVKGSLDSSVLQPKMGDSTAGTLAIKRSDGAPPPASACQKAWVACTEALARNESTLAQERAEATQLYTRGILQSQIQPGIEMLPADVGEKLMPLEAGGPAIYWDPERDRPGDWTLVPGRRTVLQTFDLDASVIRHQKPDQVADAAWEGATTWNTFVRRTTECFRFKSDEAFGACQQAARASFDRALSVLTPKARLAAHVDEARARVSQAKKAFEAYASSALTKAENAIHSAPDCLATCQ